MNKIPRLSADTIVEIASHLRIVDHITGASSSWMMNAEQRRYLSESEAHPFLFVSKPRQIGMTTVVTLDDVLAVQLADSAGHRMRCGIVVDTDEKTRERMSLAADFCAQIGLPVNANTNRIVFPNKSEIIGMTAGGNRAGASTTFQRLHLSELPFWPDPAETYAALMPALSPGGTCVIESTMDTTTAFARDLWRAQNQYHKVFFPVEDHLEYRAPAGELLPEKEEWLRKEGFNHAEAMAWWMWALENLCGGDVVRCMREFPQRPEHMFQSATARWVRTTPKVLEPIDRVRVIGVTDTWHLDVFVKPSETTGDIMIGVDTATGKGQDRSVVAVIDRISRRMVACFASDVALGDDVAKVAQAAWVHYAKEEDDPRTGGKLWRRPYVLIEDNTTGQVVIQPARRLGFPFDTFDTDEATKLQGLSEAKRAVEAGQFEGPKELAQECDELHRNEHGRFIGHKDILMAAGFCYRRIAANPPVITVAEPLHGEGRIDGRKMVMQAMRRERMGLR